jgi:bifunctional DNA-binding transcriptional regulator/antitoxin component of YhaV-PrlF toxin-antitoxin module
MTTLTITAKGQVTLKQELLRHLNVGPGQKVHAEKLPDGGLKIHSIKPSGSIEDFIGFFDQADSPRLSIEEINQIAADGWAGKL